MKRKLVSLVMLFFLLMNVLFSTFMTQAATVNKSIKTYEIAVVFDNSGSMYNNQAWCRAKYAMEIFSSMLHYDTGDVLKIFPMWPVTTDGSKPERGGSYSGIEIRGSGDINKISNLYTVSPSNTPFAPITEAYDALKASGANEKWLIVLTDGEFNQNSRDDATKTIPSNELQNRLMEISSTGIKVQYLGFGGATSLASDPSKNFYAKKSSDTSLKDDLISICNTIFQRSVLPVKYISDSSINLDMSMKSLIVFAQGSDAKISGLKSDSGKDIAVKLDSGQRKFSTISAGKNGNKDYSNAPTDNTLAGQVVTFDACSKGKYELNVSGAEAVEMFYEPDVAINMTLTDSDGNVVDHTQGTVPAGDYTVNYSIVDAVTGEDVTRSELMGNDVSLTSKVRTADGTETPFENGATITLNPDDATKVIVEGTYLKDYTISTEDDPYAFPELKVELPKLQRFKVELMTEQKSSWYQIGKEAGWKPVIARLSVGGVPLTAEQMANTKLDLDFSKDIKYSVKQLPDESAYEIMIGYDENGQYVQPDCSSYKLNATATIADEFGQQDSDKDSISFDVQRCAAFWRWLKWIILLALLLALIIFILTRKAWPKKMRLQEANAYGSINIGKNINLASNAHPGLLDCSAEKNSMLMHKFTKKASVKVTSVNPGFNVASFVIGANQYTKSDGVFVDASGREFNHNGKGVIITNNKTINVELRNGKQIQGTIRMN